MFNSFSFIIVFYIKINSIFIKLLEINFDKNILAPNVIKTLKDSFFGILNIDYIFANPSPSNLSDDIKSLGLRTIEWDLRNHQFLRDISSLDLLIYRTNDEVSESWPIEEQIKSLQNSLKVNADFITNINVNLSLIIIITLSG